LEEPKKIGLRKTLERDPRFRITKDEFMQLASHYKFTPSEAEKFLSDLDRASVLAVVPQASNFVFLKPERLGKHLADIFDPEATEFQRLLVRTKNELEEKQALKTEMDLVKSKLDARAERSASRILWLSVVGLVGHATLVARLTWWELSWDIVEPITYLVTYSTSIGVFLYFCTTRVEYNYLSLFQRMVQKRKDKTYQKYNFDKEKYDALCKDIDRLKLELERLGEPWKTPPHIADTDLYCDVQHYLPEKA